MQRVVLSLPATSSQHFAISKFSKSLHARTFQTATKYKVNANTNNLSPKLQTLKFKSLTHLHKQSTNQPLIRYRSFATKKAKVEHKHQEEYDIVIVGGGMVGSALACALASTPITSTQRIALIETTPAPPLSPLPPLPDLRVSSINLSSVDLFKAIGAWDLMTGTNRVAPYYNIEVWDGSGPGAIHFDNQGNANAEELGYIIENRVIIAALNERLKQFPNVKIINKSVKTVSQNDADANHDDFFNLETSDEKSIKTRLLVGADGANSIVRTFMNKPATGWSYNQRGIVCTVEHSVPNKTAYQRFLPYGPVALLPLFGNYSSIVWSTIPAQQEILGSLSDADFLIELQKAFTAPVKRVSQLGLDIERMLPTLPSFSESPKPPTIEKIVGPRAAFPLRLMHANDYSMHRAVLIGDAAHNVHPLAGQGVNLGFGDVAALTNEIIHGIKSGEDIGSEAVLRRYQKERKAANVLMMAGTDGLKRLFDSSFLPLTLARNVGLSLTNAFTPLKSQIVKYASGSYIDVSLIGK